MFCNIMIRRCGTRALQALAARRACFGIFGNAGIGPREPRAASRRRRAIRATGSSWTEAGRGAGRYRTSDRAEQRSLTEVAQSLRLMKAAW